MQTMTTAILSFSVHVGLVALWHFTTAALWPFKQEEQFNLRMTVSI